MPASVAEQTGCNNVLSGCRTAFAMSNQVFTGAFEILGTGKRNAMLFCVLFNVVLPHGLIAVVAQTFLA
ncbi:hypothetical protein [Marinobacter sp. RI1]|uniref:hypothetical protein n=1 Tax=Marinobacter sp. RI1 TaxID=3158171 RepID=UPI0034E8ABB1